MKTNSHKRVSRLSLLMKTIHRALELPKMTRFALAMDFVAAVERLGFTEVLADEGISFARSQDVHNDARVNAQKLFRWLGQYEGQHPQAERLFHVEQALVAALPAHLRTQYLNDVFSCVGVTVIADQVTDGAVFKVSEMAASLTKENSEAQVAVIHLGNEPQREQLIAAHRELKESAATTQASMAALELAYPYLAGQRIKAV
ncbi:hypothetical protein Sden_3266 [Shewanella denitrificans OS217]|uniref:Bacterial toxin YdaT domain-containing protein n=1 Tax=Shewanella denitrificans (strain OS217 / ATCC BAA-1090 / DSM 15013) TaxID=318161 RepID=Q12J34_SHEDO|nr:hypothetical protein [Shewanella denitrificans]ABE56542.1 hypothetical protein Sden_3266 [Shewanella denitrificans OS217]